MATRYMLQEDLDAQALRQATPAQAEKLPKMMKMGWKISKLVYHGDKTLIFLNTKDNVCGLLPCGNIERAPVGKRTVSVKSSQWK